jgi:hypothetical protein
MSLTFELGQATLDGPDDVDKLLQGVCGFRRQLGPIPDRLNRSFGAFQLAAWHGQSLDLFQSRADEPVCSISKIRDAPETGGGG